MASTIVRWFGSIIRDWGNMAANSILSKDSNGEAVSLTSDAITELVNTASATQDGGWYTKKYTATTETFTAAASIDLDFAIPTNARIESVQLHVLTALTGGELWDAEWNDGSSMQAIATSQAVAQNTNVNKHWDVNADAAITDAETKVVITKTGGGAFTAAGEIQGVAFAKVFVAWADE